MITMISGVHCTLYEACLPINVQCDGVANCELLEDSCDGLFTIHIIYRINRNTTRSGSLS